MEIFNLGLTWGEAALIALPLAVVGAALIVRDGLLIHAERSRDDPPR